MMLTIGMLCVLGYFVALAGGALLLDWWARRGDHKR